MSAERESLDRIFVGGNHLASAMIGLIGADHPSYGASLEEGRRLIPNVDYYDLWVCWRTLMRERDAVAEREGGVKLGHPFEVARG